MTQAKADPRKAALTLIAQQWPDAKLGRTSSEDLIWLLDIIGLLEGGGKRSMAETLNNYRKTYEDTAAYSGRLSKHNGDDVAKLLAGSAPSTVIFAAELILGLEKGELQTRYANLNQGQRRMNGGNRIRAAFKRGDCDFSQIEKAMTTASSMIS